MTCRRRCGFFFFNLFPAPKPVTCLLVPGEPFIHRPQLCLWGSQARVDEGPTLLQSCALLWAH